MAPKSKPNSTGAGFAVEMLPIADLREHPRNSRLHGEAQLAALERRFRALGWYKNVVVARFDGSLTLLAGHGIVAGARRAGETVAPCHVREIDPASPEALDILEGDNAVADLAEDDLEQRLANLVELGERLENTGFDQTMLDALRAELEDAPDPTPPPLPGQAPEPPAARGDTPAPLSDTQATIGAIRFTIERDEYLTWENELRESMGFDKEKIIAEVRRRLGL